MTSRLRLLLFALFPLSFALCPLLLAAEDPPREDPSAAEDVQDVVFLSEARPILFRLHLEVDGKPYVARWEEYLRKLFTYLDRNGDGVLDRDEAARAPIPQQLLQLFQGNVFVPTPTRPPVFAEGQKNEDGAVTPAGFLDFYRRSVAGPVQALAAPLRGNVPDPVTDALFNALDLNKDGKLSPEELDCAHKLLAKFDENDDEMITPQELSTNAPAPGRGLQLQAQQVLVTRQAQPNRPGVPRSQLLLVPREGPESKIEQRLLIARQVLDRYDKDKNRKVSRDEIGLPREVFDRLDVNHDGELDDLELLRWLVILPDVEVTLRLGKAREREPFAELFRRDGKPEDPNLRRVADNTVQFKAEGARVSVVRREAGPVPNNIANTRSVFMRQFSAADKNNKGYLTRQDVDPPQQRNLKQVFDIADRDGDGKLTEEELNAWFDLMADGAGCVTTVALLDNGRGLFTLLDADKDGRLSVRELRNAWSQLAEFDREGSGAVGRDQLPLQYEVLVSRGTLNNLAQPAAAVTPRGQRGPLWFRKMDVNGDGDVSPREFLGSIEDFRRIDTDGDGLISVEEAERADAWFRQRQGK
jgi:Ca2+-binding EF-hand superfamily protein